MQNSGYTDHLLAVDGNKGKSYIGKMSPYTLLAPSKLRGLGSEFKVGFAFKTCSD